MTDRLPKPIYFEGVFILFKREKQFISYKVFKWVTASKLNLTAGGKYAGQSKAEMLKLV